MSERQPIVRPPYELVPQSEIEQDVDLLRLVKERQPEAVIKIPEFPNLVYLRTDLPVGPHSYGHFDPERGLYYDRGSKALVDLEHREDGKIVPTAFEFSMEQLRLSQRKAPM